MSPTDLEKPKSLSCRTELVANIRPRENNPSTDYYEILRIAPQADDDTIERVYRTLAARFRPDNLNTGDPEVFVRLREAYEILSDQRRRSQYNLMRQTSGGMTRFRLNEIEFFNGVRGAQNRRLAVLCLLYRRRISSLDSPGLSPLDLEFLTGCTRSELDSALWYLSEKSLAAFGEFSAYSITVDGFDVVESNVRKRLELRSLATLSWYSSTTGEEEALIASDHAGDDSLPLDIEAVIQHDSAGPDHYEILGIDPYASDETVRRVYRTLADRYHPDNPETGSARTFEEIRRAYEGLSEPARRAEYNAALQKSRRPAQFRLEAREFFHGVRGEELRRLAVLCLLYRQESANLAGLTVLDLEQSTGCTREELGSALWYLREKKWARLGDYTQYNITAAGFDVVEARLEERDAARSRAMARQDATSAWRNSELAGGPVLIEEKPAMTEPPVWSGDQEPSEGTEMPNPWTWLHREDIAGGEGMPPPEPAKPNVTMATGSYGVNHMETTTKSFDEQAGSAAVKAEKRVVFSMGGKGGVGKTSVMTGLAEWFEENRIPVTLLDLDTENKAKGSLTHFFDNRVPKINIHTPAGLDAFIDILAEDAQAILADMGAGAGQVAHDWFQKMHPDAHAAGVVFTAVGVVTSDPASVESVLSWAAALEDRVSYIIVENNLTEHSDFSWWQQSVAAEEFRTRFHPAVIRMDYRLADLENTARNYGTTLGKIARRAATAPELQRASLVMRAQSARRRMFAEFDKVKELLLP